MGAAAEVVVLFVGEREEFEAFVTRDLCGLIADECARRERRTDGVLRVSGMLGWR